MIGLPFDDIPYGSELWREIHDGDKINWDTPTPTSVRILQNSRARVGGHRTFFDVSETIELPLTVSTDTTFYIYNTSDSDLKNYSELKYSTTEPVLNNYATQQDLTYLTVEVSSGSVDTSKAKITQVSKRIVEQRVLTNDDVIYNDNLYAGASLGTILYNLQKDNIDKILSLFVTTTINSNFSLAINEFLNLTANSYKISIFTGGSTTIGGYFVIQDTIGSKFNAIVHFENYGSFVTAETPTNEEYLSHVYQRDSDGFRPKDNIIIDKQMRTDQLDVSSFAPIVMQTDNNTLGTALRVLVAKFLDGSDRYEHRVFSDGSINLGNIRKDNDLYGSGFKIHNNKTEGFTHIVNGDFNKLAYQSALLAGEIEILENQILDMQLNGLTSTNLDNLKASKLIELQELEADELTQAQTHVEERST